jgi:hypothetical protein
MEKLIQRLREIEEKNNEDFSYEITIHRRRGGPRSGPLLYRFICRETADRHEFVSGVGTTIESMAAQVLVNLPAAAQCWHFTL